MSFFVSLFHKNHDYSKNWKSNDWRLRLPYVLTPYQKLLKTKHLSNFTSNNSKVTVVTNTKRINYNLLRKETSFVCYRSSVLRKSRHMKQIEKRRTAAKIKTQDYKIDPN